MKQEKHLIVIGGATGSGKTRMAEQLAIRYQCDIISADSRQIYKGMDIGTAKVKTSVNQHFIDFLEPDQGYSAGDFERDVFAFLDIYYQTNDYCILCGGSMLYIQAVCGGLDSFPEVSESANDQVNLIYAREGLEGLKKLLFRLDPNYYKEVDLNNAHRLMRALRVCISSGQPFSSFRKNNQEKRSFQIHYFWLGIPRNRLYNRIEERVDQMLSEGWLTEVNKLYSYKNFSSLNTVGYKEILGFIEGQMEWEAMRNEIKIQTRRYAKRQYTWMRRDGFWITITPNDYDFIPTYLTAGVEFKKMDNNSLESEYVCIEGGFKSISVIAKKRKSFIEIEITQLKAAEKIQIMFCSYLLGDFYFEKFSGDLPPLWKEQFEKNQFRCIA
jgi:tRNA dimethylallyltransferase